MKLERIAKQLLDIPFGSCLCVMNNTFNDSREEKNRWCNYPRHVRVVDVPLLMRMLLLLIAGNSR